MNPQFEINLPYVPQTFINVLSNFGVKLIVIGNYYVFTKLNLRKMISVDNDLEILDLYKTNTLSLQLNDQWFTFKIC